MDSSRFSNKYLYPKLNAYDGLLGKIPLAHSSVFIGVEVEAEGVANQISDHQVPGSWNCHGDGSLKQAGMEFVTVPIRVKYIEMELRRLFNAIPLAVFSSRTSIHIHMNARDFTNDDLIKFLILYLIYERNLYSFSGNRWLNNFCVPLHAAPEVLLRVLRGHRENDLESYFQWHKYHGLNILPLIGEEGSSLKTGTIEFRHMIGNNKTEYIMDWINLILSLKVAAKRLSLKWLIDNIDTTSSIEFCSTVFGQWSPIILEQPNALESIKESKFATKVYLSAADFI